MATKKTHITQFQILALLLTFLALSSLILLYIVSRPTLIPESTEPIIPTDFTPATTENISNPTRIKIPNIAVDAAVKNVTLTSDGLMAVPKNPNDTGWYELGPRPGEIGSAVIDGHVDWYDGATSVFKNLHKIKPGDKIFIIDEKDTTLSFVVRESKIYDFTADATDIFTSKDNLAHLNLITCIGDWDNNLQQYSERLVVFADREL